MNTTEKIVESLDKELFEYKKPVTILSKTDENDFIINDTLMFDWDKISELYDKGDDSSSVDAIYCCLENNILTLYFFEFKNHNLYDKFFDAKKQLEDCIENLEECAYCCSYPKELRRIKKKLVSKKIISLKTKPLESLILLHNILNELGIPSEEIITVNKEYYIISKTPVNGNKSNFHRQRKNREIFGFVDKITPFPFIEVNHLDEISFLSLIEDLERKKELNT